MGSKDDPSLTLGPFSSLPKAGEQRDPDLGPFALLPSTQQEGGDLARGLKESFQQVPQLGYGVLAGIGAGIESVAGEGGIGTGLKKAGVEGYNRWGEKIAAGAKESDSWDYSWDQAKQGNFGALVDWLAHGIGYTGGQGIQMLVGAGIGSMVGKATLGTMAESLAQGLVNKEALRIAEKEAAKSATTIGASEIAARAASPEVIKAATSSVASTIGQTSAVAASSFAQEGGEIFGDLVSTAQNEGRQLSGAELGKAFAASLAAGGLEFVGDKLGLDVILGRSKLLKPAEAMTGIGGRAARAGLAVAAEAPVEGATEYLQTGLEQYGKGEEANILPFNQSAEGQKQAREAAALGILGGVVMGGAGGALQGPKKQAHGKPQEEPPNPPLLLPAPTGILGSSAPRPVVQFQDGTYGTVEDAQNYINAQVAAAPLEQQANVRQTLEEQLLGIGRPKPTPAEIAAKTGGRATTADILDADTSAGIDEAIELAQRAVGYRTGLAAIDVQELSIPTLTDVLDGKGLMPEIPVGQASEADLASVRAPLLPVGEATEMLPVGEATEIEDIPIGQASEMGIGATQEWASAERNLQREVDAARINRILDGDLLTKDGMPYGSKTAALLRAKREGLTLDHVIEIPDAGWVVRPNLKIQVAEQPNMQPVAGQPTNAPGFTAENTLQQQQPGATVAQPQEPGVVGGHTGETNGQEGQGRRQEVLTPPGGEIQPPTAPTGEVTGGPNASAGGAEHPGGGKTDPKTPEQPNVEGKQPKPPAKPKRPPARATSATKATAAREAARADYFTPGNIVQGYGGADRVVSYTPAADGKAWSVTVQAVRRTADGNGYETVIEGGRPARERTHATEPDAKTLANGPLQRAEKVAAKPTPEITNTRGGSSTGHELQTAMSSSGWAAEDKGSSNTHWQKHSGKDRYTAILTPAREGKAPRIEVTALDAGGIEVQVAAFDVESADQAAKSADAAIAKDQQWAGSAKATPNLGANTIFTEDAAGNAGNGTDNVAGSGQRTGEPVELGLSRKELRETEEAGTTQAQDEPKAAGPSVGTLVPVNMREASGSSLVKVAQEVKSSEENRLGGRARMSTGGIGIGVDRTQEIADKVSAAWASGPEIKVVDTEAELPQSALDEIQRLVVDGTALPSGFFDSSTGAIYMVASNIKSDAEAVKVLVHEAVGHFGMRAVFGADFANVLDSFSTIAEKRVREMADRLGYDFDNIDDRRAAAEEVLAYMAETNPSYGWVRKIVATIAKWLRSVFPDLSLTDSEIIRDFIVPARDWVAGARQEKAGPASKTSASDVRFRMLDALRKAGGGPKIVGNVGRQYTPQQLRAMRNTGMLVDKPTLEDRVKDLWSNLGRKIEQGVFDQFAPIQDIDRHAYSLLRLAKGASGAFQTMLQGGMLKIVDGSYAFDPTRRGGVIERLLKPLQGEHHDFLRWVAANRADQLTQEDREHLFGEQDIEDLRTLADGTTTFDYTLQHNINGRQAGTVTRDRTLIYADAAKTLDEFNKMTLDMAEESGLIDGESRQFWEKEFYVPFYRVADESEGGVRGTNIKSGVVRQEAFKHLKGGTQKLNADLMDNVLMNWAHLLDASAKNRAAKATLDALVDSGHAFESTETAARQAAKSMGVKDHVVWIKDGGTKHFYVVDDPAYMMALTSLEYAGLRGTAMDVMGGLKHAITVGVTASPFFKVRNLIRDSIQSIATSPIGVNPLTNVAEGWKLSNQTSDSYFNLLASGGTIHFGTMLEGSESKRIQALVESGIQDNTILNSDQKYRAFYRKHIEPWLTAYNELGNRGETVNRASLYDQLRKQGLSHTEASIQARDLMDFSMQGTWTAVRFLAQVVPFFNARLQGLYKLKRAAREDPKRFAAVVGATATASVMLLLAYSDDDDWRKREDWDRNNFWWFKIGGTAFRIPKPFEVGAIATLAERGFELFFDREMTGKRFRANVLNILSDQLNMDPIPQIAKPMLGVYANVDGYTGRPIETEGQKTIAPEYRFNASTSMTARAASTGLNTVASWFGGKSLSPVQVDYLIQGYFAWLGTFVVQAADIVARPITDQPERPSRDWLKTATGGMLSDLNDAQSRYVSQMYDQGRVLEQAYHTYRTMLREGKVTDAIEYLQEHREEISKYRQLERAKSVETKLNLRQRQIENDSTMSAEQKRNAIREILRTREMIAKPVTEAIQ